MALNTYNFPNGFGGLTGDELVTSSPWSLSGVVYYVSTVDGDDTNAGTEQLQPFATLAAADAVAVAGDVIVLADDYDETFTSNTTIGNGITIVGAGSDSSGNPTAKMTYNMSSGVGLTLSGSECELRNVLFPTRSQANAEARVQVAVDGGGDRALIKGCRFECTATDTGAGLKLDGSSDVRIEDCSFVVTSTTGDPPEEGLLIDSGESGVRIVDCTFDGGTLGFADGVGLQDTSSETLLSIDGLSLLNGADAQFHTGSTGRISMASTTGSGRIKFQAPP